MNSMPLATSVPSIVALTSSVYGSTVFNGPPATASEICGPFASRSLRGRFIECVSSIVVT